MLGGEVRIDARRGRRKAAGRTRAGVGGAERRSRCGGRFGSGGGRPVPGGVDARHVGVGRPDGRAGLERLLREPPQVLDEGQLQHARPGPQLADRERSHGLVAVHEAHQLLPVQAAVAVADELHGQGVDARVARELAEGELGQLAVVAGREVPAHVEDLGGDEMVVVEEPLRRGRDELSPVHVVGHGEIRLAQDARVVVEARQDVACARRGVGSRVNLAASAFARSSSRSMLSSSSRRGFSGGRVDGVRAGGAACRGPESLQSFPQKLVEGPERPTRLSFAMVWPRARRRRSRSSRVSRAGGTVSSFPQKLVEGPDRPARLQSGDGSTRIGSRPRAEAGRS